MEVNFIKIIGFRESEKVIILLWVRMDVPDLPDCDAIPGEYILSLCIGNVCFLRCRLLEGI